MAVALKVVPQFCQAATAASSGITVTGTPATNIVTKFDHYSRDNMLYRLVINTNTFTTNIPSDAALAFGQKLFTYPSAIIQPLGTTIKMTSTCATGLSATAGEIGLGTTIGSGANATLGAVAAGAENVMEGTTISNHVAATTLTSNKAGVPVVAFDHGATGSYGIIDATAGTSVVYANVASTWDQTAAEDVTWQMNIVHHYLVLGLGFGTE